VQNSSYQHAADVSRKNGDLHLRRSTDHFQRLNAGWWNHCRVQFPKPGFAAGIDRGAVGLGKVSPATIPLPCVQAGQHQFKLEPLGHYRSNVASMALRMLCSSHWLSRLSPVYLSVFA
jgi:hypothetical protein